MFESLQKYFSKDRKCYKFAQILDLVTKPPYKEYHTEFGKNVKFLRRMRGLTQKSLAESVGLNRSNIASYESGMVEPSMSNFVKLCNFLETDPTVILTQDLSLSLTTVQHEAEEQQAPERIMLQSRMAEFIHMTNDMTKVLEGYRTLWSLRNHENSTSETRQLRSSLDDLLHILSTLIRNNWELVQSIHPGYQEEE